MKNVKPRYTAASPVTKRTILLTLAFGAALLLLAWAGSLLAPSARNAEEPAAAGLAFSEVMTANEASWPAPDGGYYDWVELVNAGSTPVSAEGWKISDSIDLRGAVSLPAETLEPGQRVLVYCAGRRGVKDAAEFALSKDGASLFLIAPDGTNAETLRVPPLKKGEVYARSEADGTWSVRADYTPGEENTAEAHANLAVPAAADGSVVISELMAANESTLRDAAGDAPDWIELHNIGSLPVSLGGWALTTDLSDRQMWAFPDVTLMPDEYRIVFASGKASSGGELHASFRLDAAGEDVYLIDDRARVVSQVSFARMEKNQSLSRKADGTYIGSAAPSPGAENTAAGALQALDPALRNAGQNPENLYINEVACSMQGYPDWLELYNASGASIDLTGWRLSDSTAAGRWTFPDGTVIGTGEYKVVFLTGGAVSEDMAGKLCADFALRTDGTETVALFRPDGSIADAVALMEQYGGVSYGRADGYPQYRYFTEMTPGTPNARTSYARRAAPVEFSQAGGIMPGGETVVTLSAENGSTIRYTTDGSEPNESSPVCSGPISLTQTTVLRAKAYLPDALPSLTAANTCLFGESTSLRVVCVSGDPAALTGEGGVLKTGEKTKLDVNVEVYDYDGTQLLEQSCELMVIGANTRTKYAQKAMRLTARSRLGGSAFEADLFSRRGYDDYKAFVMRASGQDSVQSHMRDSVLTSLAADTEVFYQETELAALYVNGQYWGMYNMREHIDAHSICQFEGWEGCEDDLDILEGHEMLVAQGTKAYYKEMMALVQSSDFRSDATIEQLRKYCDIENYLDYVALMMYVEQEDLGNIRIYRNRAGDGLWRWVIFDLDFSFSNDKNNARVWLEQEGRVDAMTQQDNTLFYRLMQNDAIRDQFLRRMGELMTTTFTPQNVISRLEARYNAIADEMEKNCARWGTSYSGWQKDVKKLAEYASTRTEKLIGYFQLTFRLTDAQVQDYFGAALANCRQ